MANQRQAKARRASMTEHAEQLQELHFPKVNPELLWSRNRNHGYTTVPRTFPIVMQAINAQSKGTPAGHTLFCLWARSPDRPVVFIESEAVFAAEAGFDGKRAVDTWRRRMRVLRDLQFIQTSAGLTSEFQYVLLLNPNAALQRLRSVGKVQKNLYSSFVDRMNAIGAQGDIAKCEEVLEKERAAELKAKAKKGNAEAKAQVEEQEDEPKKATSTSKRRPRRIDPSANSSGGSGDASDTPSGRRRTKQEN